MIAISTLLFIIFQNRTEACKLLAKKLNAIKIDGDLLLTVAQIINQIFYKSKFNVL